MEFCYEMPVWMSLGVIFFLARFARSINIDKQSSDFSKGHSNLFVFIRKQDNTLE